MKKIENQQDLWNERHKLRQEEHEALKETPNIFAKECVKLIPNQGLVLEIGCAGGRDAIFFSKEKQAHVIALDFSHEALKQLKENFKIDGVRITPILAEAQNLPLKSDVKLDAVYSRSSLHLSDQELEVFMSHISNLLKPGGYLMIEGKTNEDPKISRSEEISSNLFQDNDGHIRRVWNIDMVDSLCDKYQFDLISSKQSEELLDGVAAKFINFIMRKL